MVAGYLRADRLPPGAFVKFYFGGPRAGFGLPPTRTALDAYLEMLCEWQLPWLVSIQGGDLIASTEFARYVIERGGHLQVGLEPNPDRIRGNVELVSAADATLRRTRANAGQFGAGASDPGAQGRDQFFVGVIW